jgi:hypothetical protein
MSSAKPKKDCPKHQILNPTTNRCISIHGSTYKTLVKNGALKPVSRIPSPISITKPKSETPVVVAKPKTKTPSPFKPKKIPIADIKIDPKNKRTYVYVVNGEDKKVVSDLTLEQAYSVVKTMAYQTKFSQGIVEAYEKHGSLTDRQLSWLMKIAVESAIYDKLKGGKEYTVQVNGKDVTFRCPLTDAQAFEALKKLPSNDFVENLVKRYKAQKITKAQVAWMHKLAMDAQKKK